VLAVLSEHKEKAEILQPLDPFPITIGIPFTSTAKFKQG